MPLHVPNVHILVQTSKNNTFTETRPRWFVPLYRAIWAGRGLDPTNGVRIEPFPADVHGDNSGRFSKYESIDEAERLTLSILTAGQTDDQRNFVIEVFQRLFPNGLREEITKILAEEQVAARTRAREARSAVEPEPALLALNLTATQAVSLQGRGLSTPEALAETLASPDGQLILAECGITPDEVAALEIELMAKAEMPKSGGSPLNIGK